MVDATRIAGLEAELAETKAELALSNDCLDLANKQVAARSNMIADLRMQIRYAEALVAELRVHLQKGYIP